MADTEDVQDEASAPKSQGVFDRSNYVQIIDGGFNIASASNNVQIRGGNFINVGNNIPIGRNHNVQRRGGNFIDRAGNVQIIGGNFITTSDYQNIYYGPKYVDSGMQTSSIALNRRQYQSSRRLTSQRLLASSNPAKAPGRNERASVITAWAAAEQVAKHITATRGDAKAIFGSYGIAIGQYTILAGFDELLIQDGVGLLQQVHIFTSAEVDTGSPLLMELGQAFSPFSSWIYTPSMTVRLPIFKTDGTVWDFDQFVFDTASKLIDHGNSGLMSPTVIQWTKGTSQGGMNEADEGKISSSSVVSGSAGNTSDNHDSQEGTEKADRGKEKDLNENMSGGDNDANEDDQSSGADSDDPADHDGKRSMGVSFEVVSEVFSTDETRIFQTIKSEGKISVQVDDLGLLKIFRVEFERLRLGSVRSSGLAYEQYHLQVTIDSHRQNAEFNSITPDQTPTFERNSKVTSGSKAAWTAGGTGSVSTNLSLNPQVTLAASGTRTNEQARSLEQTQHTSCISQGDLYGSVWWGFKVEDPAERRAGIKISKEYLPCTEFQCRSDQTARPIDIEVASYWSISSQHPISSTAWKSWLTKILILYSDESRIHYSNIAQFNVLTLPTKGMSDSRYAATIKVNGGRQSFYVSDLKVREQYGPIEVASGIYGNRRSSAADYDGETRRESMLTIPSLDKLPISRDIPPSDSISARMSSN